MSYPYRTKTNGVFCEVGLPEQHGRRGLDAVIYCPGLPSSPSYPRLLRQLQEQGMMGVALRYRGSWESDGRFLEESPVKDVQAVIRLLRRGAFTELVSGARISFSVRRIFLIGSSFGGLVALQTLKQTRGVEKAVLLAPVSSMAELGNGPWQEEQHEEHKRMIERAWPQVYRAAAGGFPRLISDELLGSGRAALSRLRGKELLIFHSRNDRVVNINRSRQLVKALHEAGVHATLHELRQGHSIRLRPRQVERVRHFFKRRGPERQGRNVRGGSAGTASGRTRPPRASSR